jgi:hypothetical protein
MNHGAFSHKKTQEAASQIWKTTTDKNNSAASETVNIPIEWS